MSQTNLPVSPAEAKLRQAAQKMPESTKQYLHDLNAEMGDIYRKIEACATEEKRAKRRIEESPEYQRLTKAAAKKRMLKVALRDKQKLAEGAFIAGLREQGITEDVTELMVESLPSPVKLLEAAPANGKRGK